MPGWNMWAKGREGKEVRSWRAVLEGVEQRDDLTFLKSVQSSGFWIYKCRSNHYQFENILSL